MNKVITFCNSEYFEYGTMFLKTRDRINANFICYSPDLTSKQIKVLEKHDIEHKTINQEYFDTRMQFAKFWCVSKEINHEDNSLITFCDWDTFFINDWANEIHINTSLGITYRSNLIKKNLYRAFSNGGVIFFRNCGESRIMCKTAMQTMLDGENRDLPEYDTIWKTLESNERPKHKRHERTTLRWWVDQIFLSSLIMRCREGMVKDVSMSEMELVFNGCKIHFYDCKQFNHVESKPTMDINDKTYIRHLKSNSGASGSLKDGK